MSRAAPRDLGAVPAPRLSPRWGAGPRGPSLAFPGGQLAGRAPQWGRASEPGAKTPRAHLGAGWEAGRACRAAGAGEGVAVGGRPARNGLRGEPHRAARRPPRPPPSPVTPRPAWTNRRRCFATDTGKGRGRRKQGSGPSPGDRPELGGGSGSGATVTQQTYGAAVGAAADPGGEPERSPSPPRPLTWPWLKKSRAPEHMSSRASACLLCDMYLRQRGLRSGPAPPVCRPHAPGLGG